VGSGLKRTPIPRLPLLFALLCAAALAGAGVAFAAISVTHHVLTATGTDVSETNLPWWTEWGLTTGTIPATVPPAGGTTAAAPVVLAGSAATYTIGTAVAGAAAILFVFNESISAPVSTEIEIAVTVGVGGAAMTNGTVYMESQASAPATVLTFTFYLDTGATTTTAILVQTLVEVTQQCASVGSCP